MGRHILATSQSICDHYRNMSKQDTNKHYGVEVPFSSDIFSMFLRVWGKEIYPEILSKINCNITDICIVIVIILVVVVFSVNIIVLTIVANQSFSQ